jgi:hypothetical protein
MIQTIQIGDNGGELRLAANAATPLRFKQLFKLDLLKILSDLSQENSAELVEPITKLAYVMNMQAKGENMNALSEDGFFEWLEGFEPMDFAYASEKIMNVYLASSQPSSVAKKK